MKKLGKILTLIFASLIIIFSLIFVVIEGRTLFSGDWSLYENQINAFIKYLFRLIIALFGLLLGIFTYIALIKKYNKTMHIYLYSGVITFLITSIVISMFATNYINLLFLILPFLYALSMIIYFQGSYKENKNLNE